MSIDDELPRAGGPLVVCSVCSRTLSYDERERRFIHTLQDQRNEDHPPVPVHASEIPALNARCDFCNHDVAMDKVWTVPASDFEMPQVLTISGSGGVDATRPQWSVGDWAACIDCVRLIQRDRWSLLIRRVLETSPSGSAGLVEKAWLTALYRKLAVHITGEPFQGPTRRITN